MSPSSAFALVLALGALACASVSSRPSHEPVTPAPTSPSPSEPSPPPPAKAAAEERPVAAASVATPPSEDEPRHHQSCPEPQSISAAHILVQWGGADRASTAPPVADRTQEQALVRIREVLAKVDAGADFAALAGEYSDEPRAAERGGRLGSFTRPRMVKEFADAAFALCPGEHSGIVETRFGYHVILRME